MHPIHPYHQSQVIAGDDSISLAAALFGHYEALQKVSLVRMVKDVQAGRWDADIVQSIPGFGGRSLLLAFLGTRVAKIVMDYGHEDPTDEVAALARAMVERGGDPWAKDADGRDCLDQAFAIGESVLVLEWGKLSPDLDALRLRRCGGGAHGKPLLPWLHQAAHAGNLPMLDALFALGFDANQVNPQGETALFWAANPQVVARLLEAGCNALHRDQLGQDAKIFWSNNRKLPQTTISPMTHVLPNDKQSLTREQQVADFYMQAMSSGKGVLAPTLSRLRLQPGEVDAAGFGPLGNAGTRLLDKSSTVKETARNKARNWVEYLLSDPGLRAGASAKDWAQLWLGACRFSRGKLLGGYLRPEGRWAVDLGLYQEAVARIPAIAEGLGGAGAQDMALSASESLRELAGSMHGQEAVEFARLSISCLALAGAWQGSHNSQPFVRKQEDLHQWLMKHPELGVEQEAELWTVALCVDSAYQTINQKLPRLDAGLLRHLSEAGTPFPDNIDALLGQAMDALDGQDLALVSDLHAHLIARQTASVSRPASRPRL